MNRPCNCHRAGLGTINPCDDFVGGEVGPQFATDLIQAESAQAQQIKREQAGETLRKIAPIALALLLRG